MTDRLVVKRLTVLAKPAGLYTPKFVHAGGLLLLFIIFFVCETP